MAVRRVLAKADIRDHQKVRNALFQAAHRGLDDAIWVKGLRTELIFQARNTEQEDGWYAKIEDLLRVFYKLVYRVLIDARHAGDSFCSIDLLGDEHWVNQLTCLEAVLSYDLPQGFV